MAKKIDDDGDPPFGRAHGGPPSWFARIPTRAISDKELSHVDVRVLAGIAAYANNQGFAWPTHETISKAASCATRSVMNATPVLQKRGYLEIVSRFRSHPKWRHIYGNVYRVIYDRRLETDKLIDATINEEEPPPVPSPEPEGQAPDTPPYRGIDNHGGEVDVEELVAATALSHWYSKAAERSHGQLRLVTPREIKPVITLLRAGHTPAAIKVAATAELEDRRRAGRDAPHHLGDGVPVK